MSIAHLQSAEQNRKLISLGEFSRRSKRVLDDSCDLQEALIVSGTKPPPLLIRIMPALIHIQAHLDQDLSLDLLADEVRLSKYHFHQLFRRATGETPKDYVDRLRLERAAIHLRIRRASVLEIALECGFQNHETFSRAFRTRFAMSPRNFRQQWFRRENNKPKAGFRRAANEAHHAKLSTTRLVRLARMIVAFIRQVGPYERVAAGCFERLTAWTHRLGISGGSPLLLGIAHDAPSITPAERIRFDCCVQVPVAFDAEGEIACQRTPGGEYAITDYVGSWDLRPAYAAILERLSSNATVEILGLPAIEIYQTTGIGRHNGLAHISIAIPVRSRAGLSNISRGKNQRPTSGA
jgi:AraC family transcriptional regulator